MYVVVRSYSEQGASALFDLLGEREEDVKTLIGGVPGFVSYAAFRSGDGGMTVTVGRLRRCPVLDYKFVALGHNTIRGAAGAAILNAELMHREGLL